MNECINSRPIYPETCQYDFSFGKNVLQRKASLRFAMSELEQDIKSMGKAGVASVIGALISASHSTRDEIIQDGRDIFGPYWMGYFVDVLDEYEGSVGYWYYREDGYYFIDRGVSSDRLSHPAHCKSHNCG